MHTTTEISPFRRRLVLWLALLVGFIASAVPLHAPAAVAADVDPETDFVVDGNPAGPDDFDAPYGVGTTPDGYPTTGMYYNVRTIDEGGTTGCDLADDTAAQGGTSVDDGPIWPSGGPNPNGKTDLDWIDIAAEKVDVNGQISDILYVGYRKCGGTGTWQTVLYVDDGDGVPPSAGDQSGDVLFIFDFNPSSGDVTVFQSDLVGGDWTEPQELTSPFVDGAASGDYGEVAINITGLEIIGGADSNVCDTIVLEGQGASVTGGDLNSQLKDLIAVAPLTISNCGDLTVTKDTDPSGLSSDDVFHYLVDQVDGEFVHDGSLTNQFGEPDGDPTEIDADITAGQTHEWGNVISQPDYQLDETSLPDGWSLSQISCTYQDIFQAGQPEVTVTLDDDADPGDDLLSTFMVPPDMLQTSGGTIDLAPADCVITNQTSGLVVTKAGTGDPTADFSMAVSGAPDSPYLLSLDESTDLIAFTPGTTVTVDETLPDSTPGWEYLGARCQVGDDGAVTDFGPDDEISIETVGGEVITCVLTNRQDGQVNVVKTGEPADSSEDFGFDTTYDGALDGAADFTLQIDDPANNSGDLAPGTYTVQELIAATNDTADPDFVLGDIACEITTTGEGTSTFTYGGDGTFDVGDTDATVDLAAGDIVDCTFTNEQAGRIVVLKETDGADDTFTFSGDVEGSITTDGGATATGDELVADVPAGTYAVTETIPAGWDLTDASCDDESGTLTAGEDSGELAGIDVSAGEIVTCTFTNERETADLTLTKQWGPDAVPDDTVDLTATGDDPQTAGPATGDSTVGGATNDAVLTVYPGEVVTLEEAFGANVADYEALLGCDPGDAGTLDYAEGDLSGTFTVPDDDPVDVTCTFVNERLRAELTLEKAWVDGFAGDTAEITADGTNSDTTTATAPDGASVTIDVLSGEVVDLSEVLGDNTGTYTTTLECTDEDGLTWVEGELDGTYEVPMVPENVTCTFTNTRTSTTLTLDKSWTDPADGDSVDLAITGEAGEGTGTVAGDGSTDEPATLTVYSGEVVDLAEAFAPGNPDWYSTLLTCDSGTLGYTADALSGTLEITATPDAGISCQFSNVRETAQVIVAKDVVPDTDAGLFDLSINGNVEVDDAGDGDASDPVEVFVGDPVTVSEVAGTGTDLANYESELACDNEVDPAPNTGTSGEFTTGTADATVTCTFTNTRKSAELTLTKDWVNGADGDMVSLTASGDSGNSVDALGSSTAPDTDSDAVLTIWAGEAVTLSEAYAGGNTGSYTAELSCTEDTLTYTSGDLDGSYAVPSDPVDVTCTFVNTRTSAELTLQKDWVDGADGDTADLDVTATLGSDPADGATATADGTLGSFNDGTTVTAEVLSGETVTLDEVLGAGNTGSYDSTLSCDAAGLEPEPTTGTTGEYTMPFEPSEVTCTFTNTRTRVDLVLDKEWIDAAAGDEATLTGTGAVDDATDTSTASGAAGSELDTPVATLEVLSGETVALEEVLGDNDAVYATSLACTDGDLAYDAGELDGELTVPSDATEDITCTFTNEAGRGNIVIVKNVEGADGTFDFTGDWPDPDDDASLVGDFSITTEDETGSATWTGVLVPPDGEPYTVTELDPTPEYDGTDLVCVDPDGESSVDGLTGSIDLDVGETVTCTYTNTQRSTITVIKDAVPDDDQAFSFTTSGDPLPDTFDLVDDGTDTTNSFTSDLLPADDTYSVEETPVEGWTLTSATCDNGDSPDAIDPEPGQNVTCTFVNEAAPGSVVVTKNVEGVADTYAWSFDIAIDPVDVGVTSPQAVSGTGNTSDTVTFEPLTLNQTYTILEPDLPAGWEQTVFDCGPDAEPDTEGYQVRITEPGQQVDCTITNEAQPSSVAVYKTVEGVADDFAWSFDFTIDPATDGEPATQAASGTGNTTEFVLWENLVPGETYTITETTVPGFTAGELECTGVDDTDDDPQSVTFVAPLGTAVEFTDITCTITNTAVPSEVDVTKTVEGVADGFAWSFDFTISPVPAGQDATQPASGSGEGEATVGWTDLVPGEVYTITETTEDGYEAGVLACDGVTDLDGSDDASVQFEAPLGGEGLEIDCSITNTAEPSSVAVYKTVEGVADDYAWSFDFTIDPATEGEDATQTAAGTGNTTEFVVWENLVPGETYTITESEVDGFDIGDFACTGLDDLDDDPTSVTFVAPLGLVQEFTDVTCTVSNTAQPGSVTITKTTVGGDGSFTFAITPDGGDPVEYLVDTTDGSGEVVIDDLLPGETYTISELDPGSSWIAGELECEVTPVGGGDPVEVDPAAGFTVEVGDSIACGITNTAKGTIIIVKNVEGADGTFEFTGDWTPDGSEVTFPVTTMGGTGSETFVDVDPGSYIVSEVDPYPDYIAEAISCVGDVEGDDSSVDGLVGTIDLDPGEIVTCTFGNTETATVVVDKVTDPAGDPTAFEFQFGPLDGDATDFTLADADDPEAFGGLAPGDYLLDELVPDGWVLTDVTCSPEQFVDGTQTTITVEAGDTVTCTYTNSGRGDLVIDKTVTGLVEPGDATFTVTYDLVVTGDSAVAEPYTVTDELLFGEGITVDSATVTSADGTVNGDWDGETVLAVTDGTQSLPAGATHTYTVEVSGTVGVTSTSTSRDCVLDEGEDGTGLLNEATVTYDNGASTDDACDEPEEPQADLAVTKTGPEHIVLEPGRRVARVDYTITVTNLGPGTAVDAVATDTLPEGLVVTDVSTSVGTCAVDELVITCDLGDMAPDDQVTIMVRGITTPRLDDTFTNVVEVTSSTPDPDPDNNRDEVTTTITRELPRTGLELTWLAMLAALLLLAGLAMRDLGRVAARSTTRKR